jgi:hypothetical protein
MALVVSGQIDALVEKIVPALPVSPSAEQTAARAAAVTQTTTLITELLTYIIDELEIKSLKTTLDTSLNSVFSAGAPVTGDGGAALQIAWKAATAAGAADDATQNNDGKGLVL